MALARVSQTRSKQTNLPKQGPRSKSAGAQRKVNTWSGFGGTSWQSLVTPLTTAPTIQPKLKIGEPNDKYEQEADWMADEVMRMPDSEVVGATASQPPTKDASPSIQRMCDECAEEEKATIRRKPVQDNFKPPRISAINGSVAVRFPWPNQTPRIQRQDIKYEEEETLQTKRGINTTPNVTPGIESGIKSLKGSGQPLSLSERSFFEPRFGHDFSKVRVHTDAKAARAAQAVNARAFTLGRDLVFGAGQYTQTSIGRRLLAHELVHIVQQGESVKQKTANQLNQIKPRLQPNHSNFSNTIHREVQTDSPEQVRNAFEEICPEATFQSEGQMIKSTNCPVRTGSHPNGCKCLCEAVSKFRGFNSVYLIRLKTITSNQDLTRLGDGVFVFPTWVPFPKPDNVPSTNLQSGGAAINLPSDANRVEFGFFTPQGKPKVAPFKRILAHELCGHALNPTERHKEPEDKEDKGNRPGHDSAIEIENEIAKESGGVKRGVYDNPKQGESFHQVKGDPKIVYKLTDGWHYELP